MNQPILAEFLSEVVMTSYYLAEPPRMTTAHLHDAEMKCLKIVHTFQPLQLQKIAMLLHCGKSRATQIVHVLENKGFVERHVGDDHRVSLIRTTEKGTQTVVELRTKYQKLAAHIEQKIGSEDSMKLCDILAKIVPLTDDVLIESKEEIV